VVQRQTSVLREAVPELAEQILAEPGWWALAATLADIEVAGHDPAILLSDAVERRELDTAGSMSDVLVWRLRRLADLPADTSGAPEHGTVKDPSAMPPVASRPTSPNRSRGEKATGNTR
jgi:hypothetical protein